MSTNRYHADGPNIYLGTREIATAVGDLAERDDIRAARVARLLNDCREEECYWVKYRLAMALEVVFYEELRP